MKPTTTTVWLLCAMTALVPGVSGPAKAQAPDIVITDKEAGRDITLHGKQRLIIRLPEIPNGFGWSALMTPDALLAFTAAPKQNRPAATGGQLPMVGGSSDRIFAFRAARYTESSSERFMLIYCGPQCDLKDSAAKIFKLGITTRKK
jgi:hypothetical protein